MPSNLGIIFLVDGVIRKSGDDLVDELGGP
jgi:hypothetical protein